MITTNEIRSKRIFDLLLSLVLLPVFLPFILIFVLITTVETGQFGLFTQSRVGQHGRSFMIFKIRTLKQGKHKLGHLDLHATPFGKILRRFKLDELPQLFNVFIGQMSFVGPRPDIEGFADELEGEDRIILKVKPGVTGPATLKYRDEEVLLAMQDDPENYNRTIIWVDKVEINKKYVQNWSFSLDLKYILQSIIT